ncbi:MAG: hypothetical protein A2161_11360 [Candidatus Schekmanbacteria bacterium RBG_13_48_7]|uniref:Probable periplasmic serine endoprotease DegP-like n=1 Tax=Candidatus Schekmanbacteria bacterium RBG_13_48_7 TaxID=1817878 RepID=A0A1F7S6D7_9BACT|nr:MAG: hypothetical protein A2161_11360 [Candidatus Schekmanbacteria bacterium RBG_13_48_7]
MNKNNWFKNNVFNLKKTVCALFILIGMFLGIFIFTQSTVAVPEESSALTENEFNPYLSVFADIAEKLKPTVVKIEAIQFIEEKSEELKKEHRLLQYLMPPDRSYKKINYGSGIILDDEGYIITNTHLVEDAEKIQVELLNDDSYTAKIIGTDPDTDLALIKINGATNLVHARFGDSEKLRVGEWVMAIGHPLRNNYTVSVGVVSAKGRHLDGSRSYDEYIQTDASINPGNSGGPLINSSGEVIGINSWILTTTGGSIGLGFSIPSNLAMYIIPILKTENKVTRGWLGVHIQQVNKEIANWYNMEKPNGAIVDEVIPDSPASKAGLQNGDIIITFDKQPIESVNDLPKIVSRTSVGKKVVIELINRDRKGRRTVEAVIGKIPDEDTLSNLLVNNWMGLTLEDLTPTLINSFSLPADISGVLVTKVDKKSSFEGKLKEGDIILEINNQQIDGVTNLFSIINQTRAGNVLLFYLLRSGSYFYLTYTLQESDF